MLLDPDIVFLYGVNGDRPNNWYEDPARAALSAVRNRRIYREPVAGSRFSGLVEFPLRLRWMAELMYTGSLRSELRGDFAGTYQDTYGYALNDEEISSALFMEDNLASAGYERFRPGRIRGSTD